MRALYLGRFQPFHNGHLSVIRDISRHFDSVFIGIGSAEISHTRDNPFTAGERHLMIHQSLENEGVHNYYIIPIRDLNRYAVWVAHVETLVPPFDVLFTNNPLTKRLFKEKGYEVRSPPMYNRNEFAGRQIRAQMINGGNWEGSVPADTVKVLKEVDGVQRVMDLGKEIKGE